MTVSVTRRKLAFANAAHDVLLAETKLVDQASTSTTFTTVAYAPGIGPALLCVAGEDPHGDRAPPHTRHEPPTNPGSRWSPDGGFGIVVAWT